MSHRVGTEPRHDVDGLEVTRLDNWHVNNCVCLHDASRVEEHHLHSA
jgi:hypothetical protein